jgi:hypothetical protein
MWHAKLCGPSTEAAATVRGVDPRRAVTTPRVGIDGVIVNLPTHGCAPGVITKVGEALAPLVVG